MTTDNAAPATQVADGQASGRLEHCMDSANPVPSAPLVERLSKSEIDGWLSFGWVPPRFQNEHKFKEALCSTAAHIEELERLAREWEALWRKSNGMAAVERNRAEEAERKLAALHCPDDARCRDETVKELKRKLAAARPTEEEVKLASEFCDDPEMEAMLEDGVKLARAVLRAKEATE